MPKKQPKDMRRKKFTVTDEEAYQTLLVACGPPDPEVKRYTYVHPNGFAVGGPWAWCHHTDEGRNFVRIVMQLGEAKYRCHEIWRRYLSWWEARP